jgi:hypothetical protein
VWVVKMHNGELAPFNVRHSVQIRMPEEHVLGKIAE